MANENAKAEYDAIEHEINELDKQIKALQDRKDTLREQQLKIYYMNEMWHKLEELDTLIGSNDELYAITIVYRNLEEEDAEPELKYLNGDILKWKNGHLYYSDYSDGIVEFCPRWNCYVWHFHYSELRIEILGFVEYAVY